MKSYVGSKIISAEPMTRHTFLLETNKEVPDEPDQSGYMVIYPPDGYKSWSPAEVFENAYREVTEGEKKMIVDLLPQSGGS